jgi:hypothetical protein
MGGGTGMASLEEVQKKFERQEAIKEFELSYYKAVAEWNKKPWWEKMAEEGDFMADGSDLQPYDDEEVSA